MANVYLEKIAFMLRGEAAISGALGTVAGLGSSGEDRRLPGAGLGAVGGLAGGIAGVLATDFVRGHPWPIPVGAAIGGYLAGKAVRKPADSTDVSKTILRDTK